MVFIPNNLKVHNSTFFLMGFKVLEKHNLFAFENLIQRRNALNQNICYLGIRFSCVNEKIPNSEILYSMK